MARLWAETGGLDELETEALLSELYSLSQLLNFDRRTVQLHDVIRHFLREETRKESLTVQHERPLKATEDIGGLDDIELLASVWRRLAELELVPLPDGHLELVLVRRWHDSLRHCGVGDEGQREAAAGG